MVNGDRNGRRAVWLCCLTIGESYGASRTEPWPIRSDAGAHHHDRAGPEGSN
jgi:hypothetical protein